MARSGSLTALFFASLILALGTLTTGTLNAQTLSGVELVEPKVFSLQAVLNSILGFSFGLLLVIAALFILYAAYLYLTSGGDQEAVKQAGRVIAYALVAIVVAFLARAIVTLTQGVLGQG
jgi:hypothetical protein